MQRNEKEIQCDFRKERFNANKGKRISVIRKSREKKEERRCAKKGGESI